MAGRTMDDEESFLDWDGKPTLFEEDIEEDEMDVDEEEDELDETELDPL